MSAVQNRPKPGNFRQTSVFQNRYFDPASGIISGTRELVGIYTLDSVNPGMLPDTYSVLLAGIEF